MNVEIGEIQEPEMEDDIPDTESIAEHKVKRISAEEVVQNEFCITSSSNFLELICQLHGSVNKSSYIEIAMLVHVLL